MDLVTTPTFRYVGANAAVLSVDGFACVNSSGNLATPAVATGLSVVGTLVDGGTGDGTTKFTVKLGGYVLADNDVTDAVTAANIGGPVYVFDANTVSSNSTGTSIAGTMLGFVGTKVLVKIG